MRRTGPGMPSATSVKKSPEDTHTHAPPHSYCLSTSVNACCPGFIISKPLQWRFQWGGCRQSSVPPSFRSPGALLEFTPLSLRTGRVHNHPLSHCWRESGTVGLHRRRRRMGTHREVKWNWFPLFFGGDFGASVAQRGALSIGVMESRSEGQEWHSLLTRFVFSLFFCHLQTFSLQRFSVSAFPASFFVCVCNPNYWQFPFTLPNYTTINVTSGKVIIR